VEAVSDTGRPDGVLSSTSPTRWWSVAGSGAVVTSRRRAPPYVNFFSFFVLFVVCLNSGTRQRTFNTVSKGAPSVSSRRPWRATKILNRAFLGRRTAKGFYRAKNCHVPFVVCLDRKHTAKALPCFF
jgi:hypothetical protein